MFKLSKGWLPKYFSNLFQQNEMIHSYKNRQRNLYHIPISKTNILYRSMRIQGVQQWNRLLEDIKTDASFSCYKKKLKSFLMNHVVNINATSIY